MLIKQIRDVQHISELNLSPKNLKLLYGHTAREIIIAARQCQLTDFRGIGPFHAQQITDELQASGFIFTEPAQSAAIRRFLAKIGVIVNFNSTEDYEAREHFTATQIAAFFDVLARFPERNRTVIILRHGLTGKPPLTYARCAHKYDVSRQYIRMVETRTMAKLRSSYWRREFRTVFPNFVNAPLVTEPRTARCIDNLNIAELDLPTRAYNCLRRHNIQYVDQLRQHTKSDIAQLPALGRKSINEIQRKLHALGTDFAPETE